MPSLSRAALIAAYLYAAAAAPTTGTGGGGATCRGTSVNANFDDLPSGVTVSQVPTPYKGLYYQAFLVGSYTSTPANVPAPVPHSPPKSLAPTLPARWLALTEIPSFGATAAVSQTTSGTPMLTVNYPNSAVGAFDLRSFYFGCALGTANSVVAPPTACLITITGYKGNDNQVSAAGQVCSQQFQYNPSTNTGTQQFAFSGSVNSCFKGLQFLIIQASLPGGMAALNPDLALAFDDISYTYYPKC